MTVAQIKKIVKEVMAEEPDSQYIQSVALFGSYLHGNERQDSDIDLLYETNRTMTLFQTGGLQYLLQKKLGHKVDFVPKHGVIPQLRDSIIPEAQTIYEK